LWFKRSEYISTDDIQTPFNFETPQGIQKIRKKMQESLEINMIETKLAKAHRRSLDGNEWGNRQEREIIEEYISKINKIMEMENEEIQKEIALQFAETHIPGIRDKLQVINSQKEIIKKTNNRKNTTDLKPNSRSGVLIKRCIFSSSLTSDINHHTLEKVFETRINADLFEECKTLNEKLIDGKITNFMKDWSIHPSPFDAPEIQEIIDKWFYRDDVSFDNKGGNKTTIRNKKTGELERRIYRCMIYSRKENHKKFSLNEDFGAKIEEICGSRIGEDNLNSRRPPEVIWDKDISRSIDKYLYLVDENWKYANKVLISKFGEEIAEKILGKYSKNFVKQHVCRIPDGSWGDDEKESMHFHNCIDGKCSKCNFFKLFSIDEDEDLDYEVQIDGKRFDKGDPINYLWNAAKQHPANESIFKILGIDFPEEEEMIFYEYHKITRVTKKTKKLYTVDSFQGTIIPAKAYWAKLEKIFILSKPHFWATDVQNEVMWLERHLVDHDDGTICTTYDYTQKFEVLDGCGQTQSQYRTTDNYSAETMVTTCKKKDVQQPLKGIHPKGIVQYAGVVLSDDAGSNIFSHKCNVEKYLDNTTNGITNIVKVKGEILHSDGPWNCYKNGTAVGLVKERAVEKKYDCNMNFFSAMNGKGIWDPLGGTFKRTYRAECVPQLGVKARDGQKVVDWFVEKKSDPVRRRLNSFETRFYHFTSEEEVAKMKETFHPYDTLKHKGKGVTTGSYNFVCTSKDDQSVLARRFGCGKCVFCKSRRWPECSRQYFTGVFKKASLKLLKKKDESKQPRKKRKLKKNPKSLPYIIMQDGKIKCKICPNSKPIKSTSWSSHTRSSAHKNLLGSQICSHDKCNTQESQ